MPFRWWGRYNEDTILSLDMLSHGWCTILFGALLQNKLQTQLVPGGNTAELYQAADKPKDGQCYARTGTVAKSMMLANLYPSIARVTWCYGRWHHYVDYSGFKQQLRLQPGVTPQDGINEYGLKLVGPCPDKAADPSGDLPP
jgi:hypothetical protein